MGVELADWMSQLEARHLADLQFAEVTRALRALSSAYVERRQTAIAAGRILDSAGKRAAFALYYGPLHFAATRAILERLDAPRADASAPRPIVDLGCGTGAVGAAVAGWTNARRIQGVDVHPWAIEEARATYACFGLDATVTRGSVARVRRPASPSVIVAGYVANELPEHERGSLQRMLLEAVRRGSQLLVIEPISGRAAPWWPDWVEAFTPLGARADAWTLTVAPPELTMRLGDAAGLTPTTTKVRTLALLGSPRA
jgi:tRNA/tmRNA/rRNA uracil-C5-methylase (TrmA/RlmC/RlmD family)